MKSNFRRIGYVTLIGLLSLMSCNNDGAKNTKASGRNERDSDRGKGVTLLLKDADLMQVDSNPEYNTAEWRFEVKEPGRYDVWLSSITRDTSHLLFAENVTITAGDTRLEKRPVGDEIITDDKDVKSPWVRADSHMGSVFFSEPGEYQVQIISDRVLPPSARKDNINERTLINSLILKPMIN